MKLRIKKNIMKRLILVVSILASFGTCSYAQTKDLPDQSSGTGKTFRMARKAVKIHIDLGRASIEGHAGNEIIFSLQDSAKKIDEKAKGLKSINGLGLVDNTGLGINVREVNGVVQVSQMSSAEPSNVKILIPYGMIISFDHQSKFGKDVYFRNVRGEIDISTNENSIHLENVTGPVSLRTVQGDVEAIFQQHVKGPISMVSIYGNIDIAFPQTIRSDLKMNAKFGEIFVGEEISLEIQKQEQKQRYTNQVTGKLNGGGLNIDLRTDNGKIYLRTKN